MESPEQGNQRRDGKILTTWGVGKKILQAVLEGEVKASYKKEKDQKKIIGDPITSKTLIYNSA